MIAELGLFALVAALGVALVQAILPFVGAGLNARPWMAVAVPAARLQFLFLLLAFGALTYSFGVNDFSLVYVADNSHSALPLAYRFCAVWGDHEGSLLLWSLILGLWTFAVTFSGHRLPERFHARILGVLGFISVAFLLFMLFSSNPFERHLPAPIEGGDLNPLLQDPAFVIHPPMLYAGYVGFAVAFAFAIAALLERDLDHRWSRWMRPWALAAWLFLTLGIALGSWWAYYELGWGGWWFWDPVENASFMPWLLGTALIHSQAATDRRKAFGSWTVLLAICAFTLSLIGTFLVRSGILTSVHAFASDPDRGIFILGILAVVVGSSLALFAWRGRDLPHGADSQPLSRETLLLINSTLLVVITATILLGTLYPLLVQALDLGKLSVGAPYFNTVFLPLMALLIIAMGLGPLTRWQSDRARRLWREMRYVLWGSLLLGVSCALMLGTARFLQAAIGIALALWVVLGIATALRVRLRERGLRELRQIPSGFWGMCLAHIGLAVTVCGIVVSGTYSTLAHERMAPGSSAELSGYTFHMEDLKKMAGPNYQATDAEFHVSRGGQAVAVLHSQKRIYLVRDNTMTEAGIDAGLFRHLYVSLGEPLGDGEWSVSLYYKPLVNWIWLGASLMALGGLLSAADPRYRRAARRYTLDTWSLSAVRAAHPIGR